MGSNEARRRPKVQAAASEASAIFERVRQAAGGLADVELTTYYGVPALKVRGDMFVCMASHSSAEPNSLVVRLPTDLRDALIAEEPARYYTTPHYVGYASVLARLARVDADALRDLVRSAWRFVTSQPSKRKPKPRRATGTRRQPSSRRIL